MRSLCDSSEHMCSKWLGTCSWVPQQSAQVFGRATQACAKVFYLWIPDSRFSNSCTSVALVWRSSSVVWSALSPECKWQLFLSICQRRRIWQLSFLSRSVRIKRKCVPSTNRKQHDNAETSRLHNAENIAESEFIKKPWCDFKQNAEFRLKQIS